METLTGFVDWRLKEEAWVTERFEELGFQTPIARHLAANKADWHKAKDLIDHDCPLAQVLRILL